MGKPHSYDEPMPWEMEQAMKEMGILPPQKPQPQQAMPQPIDPWWLRGEECPH